MKQLILPIVLIVEAALFTLTSGASFDRPYFKSYVEGILVQSVPTLLLALGMTLVMMTGGIDLSVASMAALIACAISSFSGGGGFWATAVPFGLLLGLGLGLANGCLVALLDVPPIIATLGTMILYRGGCFAVMGDAEKSPFIEVPGYETLGELPGAVSIIILFFLALGFVFHHSRFRREVLMIGGNRVAARYAGIAVERRTIQVYALMGVLAWVAALNFTARNSSVSASSMTGLELQVIVAVVLGGTRVQGGAGSITGSFFGVLIISVLGEGLRGSTQWGDERLPFKISNLEPILLGLLLIVGVGLNTHLDGRRGRKDAISKP